MLAWFNLVHWSMIKPVAETRGFFVTNFIFWPLLLLIILEKMFEFVTAFSFAFMKVVIIVLPVYTYFCNYKITMWNFCSFIFSSVENKKVADCLLNIWPNIIKVLKYWKVLRKSAQPSCKSFQTVSESLDDIRLTSAKLGFFSFVASHIDLSC